jgi:SAM-dependent methyltransferase
LPASDDWRDQLVRGRSRQSGRDLVALGRARVTSAVNYLRYERRFGLDTRGTVTLAGHDHRNLPYQPARWGTLRECLPTGDTGPDDVFLDAGCGKGRVVVEAAHTFPFRRVAGFDLSPEMVAIARANIARCRHRLRCRNIDLAAADASTYQVSDDVTIVFLYNPFVGDVLAHFLDSVLASYDRRPRRLRLLYVQGMGSDVGAVEGTGRFRLRRVIDRDLTAPEARLYEVARDTVAPGSS